MYGEIYFHTYCINDVGDTARLSILKKNFTGLAIEVNAGPIPFVKSLLNNEEDLIGGIYPTKANIQLIGSRDFGMEDLYTASDNEFQVIHYINDSVDWTGFITPEGFGEIDTEGYRYLEINCFDGLTRLKDLKFVDEYGINYGVSDGQFDKSLLFCVKEALKKSGLNLDIFTLVDRLPVEVSPSYTSYSGVFSNGWLFSQGFNPLSHDLVKAGNYITYKYTLSDGYYTSLIVDVDRSEVGDGGGTGIQLEPPMNVANGEQVFIEANFFAPTFDLEKDVLNITTHDVRTWINPEFEKDIILKSDEDKKYYDFTTGTFNTWEVLDSIALLMDCMVYQDKGNWVFRSMEAQRVEGDYFRYNYDGVFIDKVNQDDVCVIPIATTETKYKLDGNTRYLDKTLKSVSVSYNYRYKVLGDDLVSLIFNGNFVHPFIPPPLPPPPSMFTPDGWKRVVIANAINFQIERLDSGEPWGKYIKLTTPNEFNSWNRLQPTKFKVVEGDVLNLSWYQRIKEYVTLADPKEYLTILVELVAQNGDVYFLVNYEDEKGWTNINYMSKNPVGQWIKKDSNYVWHFNTNYATAHNPTTGGNLTPWSKVNISTLGAPISGEVTISFVGASRKMYPTGSTGSDMYDRNRYARAFVYSRYDTTEEKIKYEAWSENIGELMTFYKGSFPPEIHIGDVVVTKVANQAVGIGRLYDYIQDGEYFDVIDDIVTRLGDEDNPDHTSILKVNGNVKNLWVTRDESLMVCPIGLLLAKSIMRRYYAPKRLIDGGLSYYPANVGNFYEFEDYPGVQWQTKAIDIGLKNHIANGTIVEMPNTPIPIGGTDYGPNSVRSSTGGSGGSGISGGASQSWTQAQGYLKTEDATLQKITEKGNVTTLSVKVRGTRNTHFLEIPRTPVLSEDRETGSVYLYTEDGYLKVNAGEKIKSGDADKWDGKLFAEYINQPVRTTDSVEFSGITANSLLRIPQVSSAETNALWKSGSYAMFGGSKVWAGRADLWNGLAQPDYVTQPVRPYDSPKFEGVGSQSFVSGFAGNGYRLAQDSNGEYMLEVDRMLVRKDFSVYELIVNQIRATNGSLWITDGIKITEVTVSGANFICNFDTDDGTIFTPFAVNDIVRCQKFNSKQLKYYTAVVVSVSSVSFTITKIEGASNPASGDELVRIGNTTNANRQGALYLTASDSGAPYLDVIDGVNSASLANKTKVRLGKLDGIIDADMGALSGYGIYAQDGYFKGKFIVQAGSNVYTKTENNAQFSVLEAEISSKVSQSAFNSLNQRVDTAETTINQQATQIALKADQTTVNGIDARLSTAELKITPDAINLTVRQQTEEIAKEESLRSYIFIDARGLDQNTFYPVTIALDITHPYTIAVSRSLSGATWGIPEWSNHAEGFALLCEWVVNGSGWGTLDVFRRITKYALSHVNDSRAIGSIGQMITATKEVVYVRGGSAYDINIYGTSSANVVLHTTAYTELGLTVSPQSDVSLPEVSDQTKEDIQAGITITPNQVNVFGQAISLEGNVTIGSLDGSIVNIANGKIKADVIDVQQVFAQDITATGNITATNLSITGNSKIAGFNINGNNIENNAVNAALVFNNLGGAGFLRINENSAGSILAIRTDTPSRTGVGISTFGTGTTGLSIINNGNQGTSGGAIVSRGSHDFYVRNGEFWNSPGVLSAITYILSSSSIQTEALWTIKPISLLLQLINVSARQFRLTHNLTHNEYMILPSFRKGKYSIEILSRNNNSFDFRVDDDTQSGIYTLSGCVIDIILFGRNKI